MKRKLLLIDSDDQLNKVHAKILPSSGLIDELHIVPHGKDALKYLKWCIANNETLPHIIVLELILPVMGGLEFIDELAKLDWPGKSNLEVVVFTSSSNPKDREKAISKGLRHFINKPYLLRGLQDVIAYVNTTRTEFSAGAHHLRTIL